MKVIDTQTAVDLATHTLNRSEWGPEGYGNDCPCDKCALARWVLKVAPRVVASEGMAITLTELKGVCPFPFCNCTER